jgi:hypothetical protein
VDAQKKWMVLCLEDNTRQVGPQYRLRQLVAVRMKQHVKADRMTPAELDRVVLTIVFETLNHVFHKTHFAPQGRSVSKH